MCQSCHEDECTVIAVPTELVEMAKHEMYKNVPKELRINVRTSLIRSDLKVFKKEKVVYKMCKGCGELKPATTEYFYANKACANGLENKCKVCRLDKMNKRRSEVRASTEYVSKDSKKFQKAQAKIDKIHGTNAIELIKCNKYAMGISEFKCCKCKQLWSTTLNSVTSHKSGCPKCAGNLPITTKEEAQAKVDEVHGKDKIIMKEYGGGTNTKSWFMCVECGYLWSTALNNVTNGNKSGCPKCSRGMITTKEEAQAKVDEVHGEGKIIVTEYGGTVNTQTLFMCCKCKQLWSTTLSHVTSHKTGCPYCKQWKHMKKVGKLIEKLLPKGFTLKSEHTFNELRHRGLLKIDFAILDSENNVVGLIEVNGIQHYKYVPHFHRNGVSDYLDQVERDNKKAVFAVENNLPLLVVPFWAKKTKDINALISPFVTRTTKQPKKQALYPIKAGRKGQLAFVI